GDFLNAFVDYSPAEGTTLRVGRQELIYGDQRLVSPLDWANTRRTFEGAKLMLTEDDWKVDAFFTHYVPVVDNRLDEADYDQPFYGIYSTYSGWEYDKLDLYYLGYDNENPGTITSDFSLHTLGSRLYGQLDDKGDWLYDVEGGVQFGRQSGLGLDQDAGFATAGIGRKYSQHPWTPTIWFYYDYASGNFPGDDFNRFNQLFPLAHKYFGFIDAVQRSNIESPNVLLTMKPTKKWDLLFWYWRFLANSSSDTVPSIGGTPTQSLSRTHFGDELDMIAKYAIGPRSNILFGYSHFWRGNKILAPQDADFFYTQWEFNF
ncbi:MAG: alginate export family protein, partial [Pirellulales bacterium]|nr:alginate export family protein [Pirellulales bacterium]